MAVEILIKPEHIPSHCLIGIDFTSHQACEERVFHADVFALKTIPHQDWEDGVVAFVGIYRKVERLEGKADGIGLGAVFLHEFIGEEARDVLFHRGDASAKDILDVLRKTTTVPNRHKGTSCVVDARHGNGLAIKPVHDECLSGKIEGIFTQIGAWRKLALQICTWKIWIANDCHCFMAAENLVCFRSVLYNPIL